MIEQQRCNDDDNDIQILTQFGKHLVPQRFPCFRTDNTIDSQASMLLQETYFSERYRTEVSIDAEIRFHVVVQSLL